MPMPKLLLPEALFIDRVESPIGTMLVFHDSEERLRALDFHDYEPRMRRLFRLHWGQEGSDFVVKNRKTPLAIREALLQRGWHPAGGAGGGAVRLAVGLRHDGTAELPLFPRLRDRLPRSQQTSAAGSSRARIHPRRWRHPRRPGAER